MKVVKILITLGFSFLFNNSFKCTYAKSYFKISLTLITDIFTSSWQAYLNVLMVSCPLLPLRFPRGVFWNKRKCRWLHHLWHRMAVQYGDKYCRELDTRCLSQHDTARACIQRYQVSVPKSSFQAEGSLLLSQSHMQSGTPGEEWRQQRATLNSKVFSPFFRKYKA